MYRRITHAEISGGAREDCDLKLPKTPCIAGAFVTMLGSEFYVIPGYLCHTHPKPIVDQIFGENYSHKDELALAIDTSSRTIYIASFPKESSIYLTPIPGSHFPNHLDFDSINVRRPFYLRLHDEAWNRLWQDPGFIVPLGQVELRVYLNDGKEHKENPDVPPVDRLDHCPICQKPGVLGDQKVTCTSCGLSLPSSIDPVALWNSLPRDGSSQCLRCKYPLSVKIEQSSCSISCTFCDVGVHASSYRRCVNAWFFLQGWKNAPSSIQKDLESFAGKVFYTVSGVERSIDRLIASIDYAQEKLAQSQDEDTIAQFEAHARTLATRVLKALDFDVENVDDLKWRISPLRKET